MVSPDQANIRERLPIVIKRVGLSMKQVSNLVRIAEGWNLLSQIGEWLRSKACQTAVGNVEMRALVSDIN